MSVTKAHIEKDETSREISKLRIDYDHLSAEYSQVCFARIYVMWSYREYSVINFVCFTL